jgi:hypothetical protein
MAISQKAESRTRTQAVSPRTSQRAAKPRRSSKAGVDGLTVGSVINFISVYAKPIAAVCGAFALIIFYYFFTTSSVFALKGIEVSQASQPLRADIEKIVRNTVGQTRLLDVDLAAIRQKVESLARVREATVARVLPDKVHISIVEREPVVLVRRNSGLLVWLDKEAVEIGEFSMKQNDTQKIPPTATGFAEGALTAGAVAENRERVAIYKRIEQEFSREDSLWDLVDEIDLSSPKYVNLQLLNSPVHVVLGSDDFKNRFRIALQVLQSVKERDTEQLSRLRIQDAERLIENADRINFLDASKPNHIVFAFSSPKSENRPDVGLPKKADITKANSAKAEKPKPVVAKASAARGEKPKASVVKAAANKSVAAKPTKPASSANRKSQTPGKQAPGKKR